MAFNFDNQDIEIPCPKCSRKAKHTIGWFKSRKTYECSGCHESIEVDMASFNETTRQLQRQMDDIERKMKNLFK